MDELAQRSAFPVAGGARNWAGNVVFRAARVLTPASVEELREQVSASREIRALGTAHSFSTIADTGGELVSVAGLPRVVDIDEQAGAVTVNAGMRYGDLAGVLQEAGFALGNLASLPHISVAGACATATHGSGVGNRSLASAVRSLEFVTADGELVWLSRGDTDFAGAVVSLGALGVVTRLTLDLLPAYDVRQWVYESLPQALLLEGFDEVMSAAYSVSLFTDWRTERINQVWVKHRVEAGVPLEVPTGWFGATLADGARHPVTGMSAEPCTEQLGVPGPWYDRLPHFRLDFTPSSGDELQSEYFVARADAVAAFAALDRIKQQIAPVLQISEIRTIAADDFWLSPADRRDSVAFHFTWLPDTEAVTPVLGAIEEALAPFGARPHWAKLFTTSPSVVRGLYEHYSDFEELVAKFDPTGKFRNTLFDRYFKIG
jgi:xylitol oxidase